jgi:hypothetical protein
MVRGPINDPAPPGNRIVLLQIPIKTLLRNAARIELVKGWFLVHANNPLKRPNISTKTTHKCPRGPSGGAGYKFPIWTSPKGRPAPTRQGITILVTGRRAMGGDVTILVMGRRAMGGDVTILVMGRRAMGGDAMSRGCRAMNDDRANADAD